MIGNSPKSDINPALEAGIHAVFVPHERTWGLEHAEVREGAGAIVEGRAVPGAAGVFLNAWETHGSAQQAWVEISAMGELGRTLREIVFLRQVLVDRSRDARGDRPADRTAAGQQNHHHQLVPPDSL